MVGLSLVHSGFASLMMSHDFSWTKVHFCFCFLLSFAIDSSNLRDFTAKNLQHFSFMAGKSKSGRLAFLVFESMVVCLQVVTELEQKCRVLETASSCPTLIIAAVHLLHSSTLA